MNAANLCPSPRAVAERVTRAHRRHRSGLLLQQPGEVRRPPRELASEGRGTARRQSGGDRTRPEHERGQQHHQQRPRPRLRRRDRALGAEPSDQQRRLGREGQRFGLSIVRVSTPAEPKSAKELVDAFVSAFTPKTRVLAITHVSNVSGVRLPARELVSAAHARGIYVHLDGAQSWGALNVEPEGTSGATPTPPPLTSGSWDRRRPGILYVKEENIPRIWPNIVAPGWGSDVDPDVKGARKFESLGQRDDSCLAAVGTTVDFHRSIGQDRVESRVLELATALKSGLAAKNFSLVTPLDPEMSGGVCILKVQGRKSGEIVNRLYGNMESRLREPAD